ncbi:dipeptide ABC transporter ATP-binding protein [Actinospica robiniae]|uniref:dipeptide ABC transporter ATP-binding protein n=1 Tax=Actinospica robiniae TaxID=304901 RepID=UPI00040AA1AE|nr:ABC transporter ATP-binding protein [Actinospica robiniae]
MTQNPHTSGTAPLRVEDLRVAFPGGPGRPEATALAGLSFELAQGQALGLVGESGSGKSAAALALLGLHRGTAARVGGRILVRPRSAGGEVEDEIEVNSADERTLRRIRGRELAMIFQEPLTSLDPYRRVGEQIATVRRLHFGEGRKQAAARAAEALEKVGIDAAGKYRAYPHEFSGGMRQRALIAMAIALEPRVLVADEPTTALDATVQAQILELLSELRRETGMSMILISHDLAVVAGNVDEVLVLKSGEQVERGPVGEVLTTPQHPYTQALLAAIPRLDAELPQREPADAARRPLVRVRGLEVTFPAKRGAAQTRAVAGVDLELREGESLGIVGESGSGKTTLGRSLVRLQQPTAGTIEFDGRPLDSWRGRALRQHRREMQLIFQDPASSLNPRRSVGESIAEPLRVQGEKDRERLTASVGEILERVGLDRGLYHRYPHQLSGGQRQRAAIARALILRPRLVVCDEPVSALDVTTQAQVVRLLRELRDEFELTLVFIAHDLAVVRQVSDRIAVMEAGRVVEILPAAELARAQDPYTRALLAAVPELPALGAAA